MDKSKPPFDQPSVWLQTGLRPYAGQEARRASVNQSRGVTLHTRVLRAFTSTQRHLLGSRNQGGFWEGRLSSSALSTATAIVALEMVRRHSMSKEDRFQSLISNGLNWLADNANADGGWGDSTVSFSNVSTTCLCWAAFGAVPGADTKFALRVRAAEERVTRFAGDLSPRSVASAVTDRYGKDRTFSAPILTMLALSGRLGAPPGAWQWVIPLPFELAALSPRLYAAIKLPVVSYALPALIAIGQARHVHAPSRNPLLRGMRQWLKPKTLDTLRRIQPTNGGFLEATPLTSFVTMSLAASGAADDPAVQKGVEFLTKAVRSDGSWPIDTNLSTWVTTLSINALGDQVMAAAPGAERQQLRHWLLDQQYQNTHPYTHAAPGGWAWTDLPGGVPDADDTPGALLALKAIGPMDDPLRRRAQAGTKWLMDLQNRDGGIPTFCRGWGHLPFDRSGADLTAHTLRAWLAWRPEMPTTVQAELEKRIRRALRFLERTQGPEGSWRPLWFGNQHNASEENPSYGTSKVLLALEAAARAQEPGVEACLDRGLSWLLAAQSSDGGWGGGAGGPSSVEETGLALEALCGASSLPIGKTRATFDHALDKGAEWLLEKVESGHWTRPSPIGFYFAKLWYYEELYPVISAVGALRQLARRSQAP